MRRSRFAHSTTAGLRPAARAALLGLLTAVLLLAMGAAPAVAPAQGTLTTLFTSMTTPSPTVTGINSVPVGPSDLGTYRTAMAFRPTQSGKAQLLSMRGQCVLVGVDATGCAHIGEVTIQSDDSGKPSGQVLGSMGFYLLENTENAWRVAVNGNPTGGTFRLRYTEGAEKWETGLIPFDADHVHARNCTGCPPSIQGALEAAFRDGGPCSAGGVCIWLTTGRVNEHPALFRLRGHSGTFSAFEVQLTGGIHPTVSVTQPQFEKECGTLTPQPQLTAGTKYWAVMTAEHESGWNDWSDTTAEVMESVDGGAWKTAFNTKTPALRIDSGVDTCVPVAEPNPDPGTQAGPGAFRFSTIAITNKGVAPLILNSATFTGANAAQFSLLNSEPGPLARPYPFPRTLGVETVSIFYVACSGASEGLLKATLTIQTNDPELPQITYPVECLIDKTPPTVGFSPSAPDGGGGWWKTSPILLGVNGTDPQPGSFVTRLDCSDSNAEAAWSPWSAFASTMSSSITGEGAHTASCKATDLAGNQSGAFTTGFKIDSRPPVAAPGDVFPRPNDEGWNSTATTVSFLCEDPAPGSGVDEPAGGGSVETETAGTDVTSSGCTDVAGNTAAPVSVPVRIDWTSPDLADVQLSPLPNAAGWHNTDVSVRYLCRDQGDVQSGVKVGWPDVVVTEETPGRIVPAPTSLCIDFADNAVQLGDVPVVVRLDKTRPTLRIPAAPRSVTNDADAVFTLSAEDALSGVAGLECRLDKSGSFEPCADRKTYADLPDGTHLFDVLAIDEAGNRTARNWDWTVDTVAPETSVYSGPASLTTDTTASFSFSGNALGGTGVTGYECRLDDAAFASCPGSGVRYSGLAGGEHSFEVRAIDEAGNADSSPANVKWTIDLTAPVTTITAAPEAKTVATDATFVFAADDRGGSTVAGVECRLDGGAFAPCTSPVDYVGLLPGRHTFEVRAADALGNVESPAVAHSWLVSAVIPVDDSGATLEDVPVSISVRANDLMPPGATVSVAPTQPTSARGGTVSADGPGSLRYVPPADFNGTDTFAYTATATGETSDPATVTVSVAPVNDAPAFSPGGEVSVNEDTGAYSAPWTSGVSAGPADESGQQLHFVLAGNSALFSVAPAISPAGQLTFVPAPNANGTATIDVALIDDGGIANGGSDISRATLAITIRPVNDAPTIAVERALECGGASGTLHLRVNDVDHAASALMLSRSASIGRIGLVAGGTGSDRTLTVTGLNQRTRAALTLGVSDGVVSVSTSIPVMVGTTGADTITATGSADLIFGKGGNDVLWGAGGNDLICGGAGADRIEGGPGDDVMLGGLGTDVIRGGDGNDVVRGGWGADQLYGGPGDDILRGGAGADLFASSTGRDRFLDFSPRQGDRR